METISRDPMLQIMMNLDDKSLLNFCLTDKRGSELCKNEDFWRNRLFSRFKLSLEEAISFKYSAPKSSRIAR